MSNLLVNTRDQQFVLFEQLGLEKLFESEAYNFFSKDDILMVLNEAEKLAVNVIMPTFTEGDRQGCTFKDGKVTIPDCFHEAYKKYIEGGWLCPTKSPDVGGQGLPHAVGIAITEVLGAANYSLLAYPGLTHGAAGLIESYGTQEQKDKYMYRLYAGEWTGTMCLTEPGAGSDVGAIKTSAHRLPNGLWSITGTKCFISAGDHNLTPNIIHPVLARIEGDPPGTKGISIFIVPKYRVNSDGTLGEFNDVKTGNIEHKMGIKGSATCTLNFGDNGNCIGELLGREREGLRIMFQMMNEARLGTGMQGLASASACLERAVAYAKERIQGSLVWEGKDAKPVTIIHHPDVRRKLLWMKAHVEGIRAMNYFAAYCADMERIATTEEEKADWTGFLDLMTPVCKAYSSDMGVLICSAAMDVFGGYGYCCDYPIEQYLRDVKIATIYEGTNGIQALDLVGRKLGQRKGRNVMNLFAMLEQQIAKLKQSAGLQPYLPNLLEAKDALLGIIMHFAAIGRSAEFLVPLINAYPFLEIMGDTLIGFFLLQAAAIADEKLNAIFAAKGADTPERQVALAADDQEVAFYLGKLAAAKYFAVNCLPLVKTRCEAIKVGDKSPMEILEPSFAV